VELLDDEPYDCWIGNAQLSQAVSVHKHSALKKDPEIWDGVEEIEDVSEFDYIADDDDLNWEEADELPDAGLPPMPGTFSKKFFDYSIPSLDGMFP